MNTRCGKTAPFIENFGPDYADSPEHNVTEFAPCVRTKGHSGPCDPFTFNSVNRSILFPQFTCVGIVPVAGKAPRPCRNTVREAGGRCWRHAEAPRVVRSVAEVYEALGNGRDADVWPPGVSAAQAITALIVERDVLRARVERLLALLT